MGVEQGTATQPIGHFRVQAGLPTGDGRRSETIRLTLLPTATALATNSPDASESSLLGPLGVQVGDNPGRAEPGTGEIHYANVFRHIHKKGYGGIVGMEHGNSTQGVAGELAVIDAYRRVDPRED